MRKSYLLIALAIFLSVLTGCLDFGEDEETISPTKDQVSRCRSEMYLNPSIKITPLGFKLEGSGIDDAIWFKFKIDIIDVQNIFDGKVVDTAKFKDGFTFAVDKNDIEDSNPTFGGGNADAVRFTVSYSKDFEL